MKLGDDVVGQLDGNKYDQGTLYTCIKFLKRGNKVKNKVANTDI